MNVPKTWERTHPCVQDCASNLTNGSRQKALNAGKDACAPS